MSWDIKDVFARRLEFVQLAGAGGMTMAALCRRFGISRKTGYKWLTRFRSDGQQGLHDLARRPRRRANQVPVAVERRVVSLRRKNPTWGPRKLHRRLQDLGEALLPGVSTFARILKRRHCIEPRQSAAHQPVRRFVREHPNELWQMDFKGDFALQRGGRCHALTVLDDCSRYLVGLSACGNQLTDTVQQRLERIFGLYGLPECILCDNGPPWAAGGPRHTFLTVWLLRLGVRVIHGRPHHPQTQGKDERFHRTLQGDLLARHDWPDLTRTQRRFDAYRRLYNHDRPHEALHLDVPAKHYRPSPRGLPAHLPIAEYSSGELVRTVKQKGEITFRNRFFYVGTAFAGLPVAIRPHSAPGCYRVCYAAFTLGQIDLRHSTSQPKGNYHLLLPTDPMCYP